jgi:hypothetical protein
MRIGPERGPTAVAVSDPAGDGSHVHPSRDQLGDEAVAKVMGAALHSEAAGQCGEALRHPIGAGSGGTRRSRG